MRSCLQACGLTSLNYIICNLGIGPQAFNIDMGLGWTFKVSKMKSYGIHKVVVVIRCIGDDNL
jgi:hypothetical protein